MGKADGGSPAEKPAAKTQAAAKPAGKDIRSFFGAKGAPKGPPATSAAVKPQDTRPGGAPPASKAAEDEPPNKKSRYFGDDGPSGSQADRQPPKAAAAAPKAAQPAAAKPAGPAAKSGAGGSSSQQPTGSAGKGTGGGKAADGAAAKKRKAVIIDDDDDDDVVVAGRSAKEVVVVDSDDDDDDGPAPARKGGSAAKQQQQSRAAQGKAKAAPKGKGKKDEDEDDYMEVSSDDDDDVLEDEESDSDVEDLESEDDEDFVGAKGSKAKKGGAAAAKAAPKPKAPPSRGKEEAGGGKGQGGVKRGRDSDDGAAPPSQPKASQPAAAPGGGRKLPASMAAAKASTTPASQPGPTPPTGGKTPVASKAKAAKGAAGVGGFDLNDSAKKAIAAVDEAVKALPPQEEVKFNVLPEGQDAQGNDSAVPPNHGNKDAPSGHPDCLSGKTFVTTGVLDSLTRTEATDYIKRHGGKVTGSVSGRTSFLLAGSDCGRSKYRVAREKGTKIIDEDGLFSLVRASQPFMPASPPAATQQQLEQPAQHTSTTVPPAGGGAGVPPRPGPISASSFFPSAAGGGGGGGGAAGTGRQSAGAGPSSNAARAGAGTSAGAPGSGSTPSCGASSSQLWVDKYKPTSSTELVGNATLLANLRQWLNTWEQVHLHHGAAPAAIGGGAKPKDLSKKAVLLSGPPGIGKTSAAHIISRECGFEMLEVNASDTRNKAGKTSDGIAGKMSNIVKEAATNTTLSFGPSGKSRRHLLVMDEVDGMSGGDRGGVQDLIQTIKTSKIPVICICNDRYSQKLKSLRNHCLELEFRKPTTQQIGKRMAEICKAEGLHMNQATLDALVEGAGGDLRLVLGQLQMVRLRKQALTYDEVKGRLGTSKDADMSPFECARKLLDSSCALLSMSERMELYFADADLVPLLVQENYVNHRPAIAANDPAKRLRAIAKAADAISSGDVVSNTLRRTQNWGLMPFGAVMSSLLPSAYMRGMRETFGLFPNEMNFPRFTAWLGNYSSGNKQRRLLGEFSTTLTASGNVSSARGAVRLEYTSALRYLLTLPLRQQEEAAIQPTVSLMQDYCINKDQFDYVLDVTQFKSKAPWAEDPFKEVPPKIKAAFTRTFNQQGVEIKCSLQVDDVKIGRGKGKGRKGGRAAADDDDEEAEGMAGNGQEGGEGDGGGAAAEEEEEEDARLMAQRLAKDGVSVQLAGGGGGGKKGGAGGAKKGGSGKAGGVGKAAGGGGRQPGKQSGKAAGGGGGAKGKK